MITYECNGKTWSLASGGQTIYYVGELPPEALVVADTHASTTVPIDQLDREQVRADLEAARTLITNPQHWMKGGYSRAVSGVVAGRVTQQLAYCAVGAVAAVTNGNLAEHTRAWEAIQVLHAQIDHHACHCSYCQRREVEAFNDQPSTKHADVLDVFDRAIKAVVG